MQFRDRIKRFCRVPAAALRQNPHSYKIHPDRQRTALRDLLAEVGLADALLVRELRGSHFEIIDGHLRAEIVAKQKLPVLVLDVTAAEAKQLIATGDPLAAMACPDPAKLDALLREVRFQSPELQQLLDGLRSGDELLDDEVPPLPAKAATKRGDLYELGRHRLLCGDSSQRADVDRLLDGAQIDLFNADPPYNVNVEPRSNNAIATAKSSGRARVKKVAP
jgi:hypothetical protein